MAEIHHERQEMDKARKMYEKALKVARMSLGCFHPDITSILNKLGNLLYKMNNHERALKYYMEGFNVEQVVLHPCHPCILVTIMNIAQIY